MGRFGCRVEEVKARAAGLALVADVCSGAEVDAAVAKTLGKFGKIDILVHCGGIRGSMTTPITELSEADWRAIIDINLTGSFLISKAVAKTMVPNGEGKKIVLIGSKAATQGMPAAAVTALPNMAFSAWEDSGRRAGAI